MRLLTPLTLLAAVTLAAGSLAAQEPSRNVPDSLVSKAKVSEDSARAVATKRVPGDVQGTQLKRVRRRLIWDFKIQKTGATTSSDVQVSAMNGKVVSVRGATRAKAKSTTRHPS
ncbi:MAG TPA: PepSY domain-containing protein [Gemmatimonadales bacterium]|nr:PepSY domain-containing protein [Gemmatimonadales bacterium]